MEKIDPNMALKSIKRFLHTITEDVWKNQNEILRLAYLRVATSLLRRIPYFGRHSQNDLTKRHFLHVLGTLGYYKDNITQVLYV